MSWLQACDHTVISGTCLFCKAEVCDICSKHCDGCQVIGGCDVCRVTNHTHQAYICRVCLAASWGFETRQTSHPFIFDCTTYFPIFEAARQK